MNHLLGHDCGSHDGKASAWFTVTRQQRGPGSLDAFCSRGLALLQHRGFVRNKPRSRNIKKITFSLELLSAKQPSEGLSSGMSIIDRVKQVTSRILQKLVAASASRNIPVLILNLLPKLSSGPGL